MGLDQPCSCPGQHSQAAQQVLADHLAMGPVGRREMAALVSACACAGRVQAHREGGSQVLSLTARSQACSGRV